MKHPTYLHQNSFGIFYFRLVVPKRFQYLQNRTEFKKSLRTRNYSIALRRAQILAAQVHTYFEELEKMINPNDPWLKLNSNWTAKNLTVKVDDTKLIELEDVEVKDQEDAQALANTVKAVLETLTPSSTAPPTQSLTFSKLIEKVIAFRVGKKTISDGTAKTYRASGILFIELIGDKQLDDYTHEDGDKFQTLLQRLPSNRTKHKIYRSKTPLELIEMNISEDKRISIATVNNLLAHISQFFEFAQERKMIAFNPVAKRQIATQKADDEERTAFTPAEMKKIVHSLNYQEQSRYWVVLLAAFTGARSNEICQLRIEDIDTELKCIHITNEHSSQKLKNKSSRRIIPIHSKLIYLGFLEYVASVKGARLFPLLTQEPSSKSWDRKPRRWFNDTYLEELGIEGKSFHCLRHSVITAFRENGVAETFAQEIAGHSKGNSITYNRYATKSASKPLIDAIEKIPNWFEEV